jgi:hypothetical protein
MELPSTNIVRSGEGKGESVRSCLGIMRHSTVSEKEWVGLEAIGGGGGNQCSGVEWGTSSESYIRIVDE